jgi:hypothetical protein
MFHTFHLYKGFIEAFLVVGGFLSPFVLIKSCFNSASIMASMA